MLQAKALLSINNVCIFVILKEKWLFKAYVWSGFIMFSIKQWLADDSYIKIQTLQWRKKKPFAFGMSTMCGVHEAFCQLLWRAFNRDVNTSKLLINDKQMVAKTCWLVKPKKKNSIACMTKRTIHYLNQNKNVGISCHTGQYLCGILISNVSKMVCWS